MAVSLEVEHPHATLSSHYTPIYLCKGGGKDGHTKIDIQIIISTLLVAALIWKYFECQWTEDHTSNLYSYSRILLRDRGMNYY